MKLTVHGPLASVGGDGLIHSFATDQPFEVDDGDKGWVAWARNLVAGGSATVVEDVKETKAPPAKQPGGRA